MDQLLLGFVFALHGCNFLLSTLIVRFFGGIKKQLVFLFLMAFLFLFTWLIPLLSLILQDDREFYGKFYSISELILVMSYYAASVSAIMLAYGFGRRIAMPSPIKLNLKLSIRKTRALLVFMLIIIVANYLILLFSEYFNYGSWRSIYILIKSEGYSYYLEGFIDSLLLIPLFMYATKEKRTNIYLLLLLLIPFLLVIGWRYRIIFLGLEFLAFGILRIKNWYKVLNRNYVGIALILLLVSVYADLNRWAIMKNRYDEWRWNPAERSKLYVVNQFGNFKTLALAFAEHANGNFEFAGPLPWLQEVGLRAVPSRLINFQKPIPHSIQILREVIPSKTIKTKGRPAVTFLGEAFFYVGWVGGVVVGSIVGFLIGFVRIKSNTSGKLLTAIFAAFMFQLVSRGYLPQNIELLAYFLVPFIVLWILQKGRGTTVVNP